ncbi:MAG TPA: SDR family NAD(P)-dependent oxidoreductase [Actinomycetes bacterium]|nr:SDR family NAD(P)-dependent oxidoreductase [Actinomycetes bacterium]
MTSHAGRFAGRTAVVTGGAGGIGRAVCAAFAAEGAAVTVVDVDDEAVAATVGELQQASDPALIMGWTVDVRDSVAVNELMAAVNGRLGGPHVLVNLAGGSLGTPRDLGEISPAHLDTVLDVNVKGTFLCCQAAMPYLVEAGGGAIVNTSSIGGRQPSPVTGVPYATAKAAIVGLTKRLAREVGPDRVRVNAIAPGLVLTERLRGIFASMDPAEQREVVDAIPLRRMPELAEIVEPILFLTSEAAGYITGVVLDVNGGRFMPL